MLKRHLAILGLAMTLSLGTVAQSFADIASSITMESSDAYLFGWRPVDCGDGVSFTILVGGNTVNESNVILNHGYDYTCTSEPSTYSRPWGIMPGLVSIDGVWGIPENWSILPEGSQPTMQIVLKINYKNLGTGKRYIHVAHLPSNVDSPTLPADVCKYLINVDGSDAGAYEGTETSEWVRNASGQWTYRKSDSSFVTDNWLTVDEKTYYMDQNGVMLTDMYAPDGTYINPSGVKVSYKPGWVPDDKGWRYIQKNGYYASATWSQDSDGKYHYFNIGVYMATDTTTPDGYRVDANGVWDGQASTIVNEVSLGPGMPSAAGWESVGTDWKFKQEDDTYVTNAWKQVDGKWYYFNESSLTVTNQTMPDDYYVDVNDIWIQ